MAMADQNQLWQMESIYFKDLHPNVTVAILYEQFSPIGPLLSIKLCKDYETKKSLGFGYINFQESGDAMSLLQKSELIRNQAMKVIPCRAKSSQQKSYGGLLSITNISESMSQRQFEEMFVKFGDLLSSQIFQNSGRGYVHFESQKSSNLAAKQVHGQTILGKILNVRKMNPEFDEWKYAPESEEEFTNLYVSGLGDDFDDGHLNDLFKRFGVITSAKVARHSKPPYLSRRFAYVDFEDSSSAREALTAINGREYNGHTLLCTPHRSKADREKELAESNQSKCVANKLFVKNLDDSITSEQLRNVFQRFGQIVDAKVYERGRGNPLNCGFVCYASDEEATKALNEMNGRVIVKKPLYIVPFSNELAGAKASRSRSTSSVRYADANGKKQNSAGLGNVSRFKQVVHPDTGIDKHNPGRAVRSETQSVHTVRVLNLPQETTNKDLLSLFKQIGWVTHYNVETDGIGYVSYNQATLAQDAVNKFNKYFYKGRKLNCLLLQGKKPPPQDKETGSRSVCVSNFGLNMSEQNLRAIFQDIGEIESVKVIRDNLGYVNFKSAKSAQTAVHSLNDSNYNGNKLRCHLQLPNSSRK